MSQVPLKIATFDSEEDGFVNEATKVWCIVLKDHEDGKLYSYGPDAIDAGLDHLNKFDVLIGHNVIAHDFPIFRRLYNWERKSKVVDTLLMSRIQRPNRRAPPHCPDKRAPHSLGAWGYRVGLGKVVHEDWTQFSPEMLHRCEQDVEINYLVYNELLAEGKGERWSACLRTTMRLFDLLQRQEEHGWFVDRPWMDICIARLERWIARIDKALQSRLPLVVEVLETKKVGEYGWVKKPFLKSGLHSNSVTNHYGSDCAYVAGPFTRLEFRRVSLDSGAETKDMLLAAGWEPEEWNYNDDGEKTSPKLSQTDPFDGVQGSFGKLIAKRVQCRHRLGTLVGLRDNIRADGTISPGVGGIAATGRLRHSVIVNIPSVDSGAFYGKQMRACFIPRPGMVQVGADSKGNQMRQLAARMDDEEFTKVVLHGTKENGDDLHSYNQRMSGVPTRTKAKNFFYGFIFGAQDAKIGKVVGGTREQGKLLRETYLAKVPKLAALIERLTEEWRETAIKWYNDKWNKWEFRDGYITGLDGRPILVDSEHKILNYALQSDEAIQMAYAYILVHDWMQEAGYHVHRDWSMLIWMHDEFQTECLPEIADKLGRIMCDAIKEAGLYFKIKCPHDGDYKVGNNWAECH